MIAFKTLIFTILVPGTVTIYIPYWILSSTSATGNLPLGAFRYFGVILILLGAAIYFRCAFDFTFKGKGTPAPIDPPKELVVQGLYRYVRNPMYVGAFTTLIGEVVLFESRHLLVYAVLMLSCFSLFVLLYEEPALRRKFGESYQRYCDEVPRWIPRLSRRKQ